MENHASRLDIGDPSLSGTQYQRIMSIKPVLYHAELLQSRLSALSSHHNELLSSKQ